MTGAIKTSDVHGVSVTSRVGINGFNVMGNPYPSYISSTPFLNTNTGLLLEQSIWVTNGSGYTAHNLGAPIELAPGQGFFIRINAASGSIDFDESNQSHQSSANFGKQIANANYELVLESNSVKKSTKVLYIQNKTTGFDNGYDSSMFEDSTNGISLYTELIANNEGEKLAIQTLPAENLESFVVPVGVRTAANSEITFSIDASNFDEGMKIFLEDRLTNTFTRLDEPNSFYKVIPENNLNGVGRFYMHTSQAALSTDTNEMLSGVKIYKLDNTNLRITGLTQGEASVHMYNVFGKQVLSTSFNVFDTNDILLPNVAKGIYFVKLETAYAMLNRKIILE
jgi:hypothetical protein